MISKPDSLSLFLLSYPYDNADKAISTSSKSAIPDEIIIFFFDAPALRSSGILVKSEEPILIVFNFRFFVK